MTCEFSSAHKHLNLIRTYNQKSLPTFVINPTSCHHVSSLTDGPAHLDRPNTLTHSHIRKLPSTTTVSAAPLEQHGLDEMRLWPLKPCLRITFHCAKYCTTTQPVSKFLFPFNVFQVIGLFIKGVAIVVLIKLLYNKSRLLRPELILNYQRWNRCMFH